MSKTLDWTGPVPQQTAETKPYWDAAAAGVLLLQRCEDCGKFQTPYRGFCCHCWHGDIRDFPSSGDGVVWSHSTVYSNRTAGSTGEPYCVAVVELEGGVRVVSNVIDVAPEEVRIGMPVAVTFARVDEELAIPVFRPR
jgi:uncharacterized OB-fold protein